MRTYQKAETEIVLCTFSKVILDFSNPGTEEGPPIDTNNPVDNGDSNGGLSNHSSLWDEEDE